MKTLFVSIALLACMSFVVPKETPSTEGKPTLGNTLASSLVKAKNLHDPFCWQYAGQISGFEARPTGTGVQWDTSKFPGSSQVFIEYHGTDCIAGISVPNTGNANVGWWCGVAGTYYFYISADCKVLQGVHQRP